MKKTTLIALALAAGSIHLAPGVLAGTISPADVDYACSNTGAFLARADCVGQVYDPKNDVGGYPTLLDYLNSVDKVVKGVTIDPWIKDPFNAYWGEQGSWVALPEIQAGAGGSASEGIATFSYTETVEKQNGDWTFSVTGKLLDYVVVSVKSGGGWSAYYYDLTGSSVSSITQTWDTLGVTSGSGTPGSDLSHISAYYVAKRTPGPGPGPGPGIPVPAPLALIGLGAAILGVMRRKTPV